MLSKGKTRAFPQRNIMVKTRCEHNSMQQHKKSLKRGWLWGACCPECCPYSSFHVGRIVLHCPFFLSQCRCGFSFDHKCCFQQHSKTFSLVCITNLIQNCSFLHGPWTLLGSILLCEEPFLGHRGTNIGCPPGGRLKCKRTGHREGE